MRFAFILILQLLITGCAKSNLDDLYKPSEKSKLVDEISNGVFKNLKKEKNLFPCECGGRMMDKITLLHWGFDYYKEITIDEARELLIIASDQFLKAFNNDARIRPYLATYPLTSKNIQIRVFINKPDGSELEPEKLHVVSMTEGFLNYKAGKIENVRLKKIHVETYEEAKTILHTTVQL